jgi:ribonuclease P/MRP protein subunit RPP40
VAKVFDSVSHQKLLFKLSKYGVTEKLMNWLGSFLSGRTQRVKVNSALSEPVNVPSNVTQGLVLGMVLFLLYVYKLPDLFEGVNGKLFADDRKL